MLGGVPFFPARIRPRRPGAEAPLSINSSGTPRIDLPAEVRADQCDWLQNHRETQSATDPGTIAGRWTLILRPSPNKERRRGAVRASHPVDQGIESESISRPGDGQRDVTCSGQPGSGRRPRGTVRATIMGARAGSSLRWRPGPFGTPCHTVGDSRRLTSSVIHRPNALPSAVQQLQATGPDHVTSLRSVHHVTAWTDDA